MKTPILAAIVVFAGAVVGGGASFATHLVLSAPAVPAKPVKPAEPLAPSFVATGKILAPLVFPNGRLAGYVQFEAQLEIAPGQADFIKARLPLLMHALNMRTYRTPMTSGPDGSVPDLEVFRTLLLVASVEAFGPGQVKRAAITQATPA